MHYLIRVLLALAFLGMVPASAAESVYVGDYFQFPNPDDYSFFEKSTGGSIRTDIVYVEPITGVTDGYWVGATVYDSSLKVKSFVETALTPNGTYPTYSDSAGFEVVANKFGQPMFRPYMKPGKRYGFRILGSAFLNGVYRGKAKWTGKVAYVGTDTLPAVSQSRPLAVFDMTVVLTIKDFERGKLRVVQNSRQWVDRKFGPVATHVSQVTTQGKVVVDLQNYDTVLTAVRHRGEKWHARKSHPPRN